jgi:hypothetical protein
MQSILLLVLSFFMPFLQPIVQHGADKMQQKLGIQQPQSQMVATQPMMQGQTPLPQPPQYYFDGVRWYKYENGQVYVWNSHLPPQF